MLEVKHISRLYGEKKALDDVSFVIDGAETVGFLGINGAGKSTTMNILTGCLSPSEGEVLIGGQDLLLEPVKAKEKIGYLPEQPPLYPEMKALEYLRFVYDLKKVKKNTAIKENRNDYLAKIMEQTKVAEVSQRLIRNLSKGYKQRVGLAQALIGNPEILILDEPTVGLDPAQRLEMRELICELAKSKTILLSSHILSEVQEVCDRIIVLHQGKIVADERTENLSGQLSRKIELELESEGEERKVISILNTIPEIDRVKKAGEITYQVILREGCEDSLAVRRKIFDKMSEERCNILSMKEKKMSLEEVFLRLTAGEAPQISEKKEGQHRDGDL